MSKQDKASPLTLLLGTVLAGSLGAIGIANASGTGDVFAMEEVTNGQFMAGGHLEGGCGDDREGGDGDDEGGPAPVSDGAAPPRDDTATRHRSMDT